MDANSIMKECSKCKSVKQVTEFPKQKTTKDKLSFYCKDCERERLKLWYEENKDKVKEQQKEYYSKNKDKIYKKSSLWYQENKEKMNEYQREYKKEYFKKHPEKLKEYQKRSYLKKLEIMLKMLANDEIKNVEGK